ncbi:hypothetical protein D3C76_1378200 [compost metagenome]
MFLEYNPLTIVVRSSSVLVVTLLPVTSNSLFICTDIFPSSPNSINMGTCISPSTFTAKVAALLSTIGI